MVMVEILENVRYFDAEDADFSISFKDGPKEMPQKCFKAMSIKHHLLKGLLKVVEGEVILTVKHAKVLFSAELYPYAYGIEFEKFFKKDLQFDSIAWYPLEDGSAVPEDIKMKLVGEKDEAVEKIKEDEVKEAEADKDKGYEEEDKSTECVEENTEEDGSEEVMLPAEDDSPTLEEESESNKLLSKEELKALNRKEQFSLFKRFGIRRKDVPKSEDERVEKLFELQNPA